MYRFRHGADWDQGSTAFAVESLAGMHNGESEDGGFLG